MKNSFYQAAVYMQSFRIPPVRIGQIRGKQNGAQKGPCRVGIGHAGRDHKAIFLLDDDPGVLRRGKVWKGRPPSFCQSI
jgi:hypothetical protein